MNNIISKLEKLQKISLIMIIVSFSLLYLALFLNFTFLYTIILFAFSMISIGFVAGILYVKKITDDMKI